MIFGADPAQGPGNTTAAGIDRRRFLVALGVLPATATLLASCSDTGASVATAPKPLGPDLSGVDNAVRAQDDLYRHINGGWLERFRLPADKASYGAFDEVHERTRDQLKQILESIHNPAAGSSEQKIRDYYDAYLDTETIERLGTAPIADLIALVDKAPAKVDLARVMGTLSMVGAGGLFALYVNPDPKNSTRYLPGLGQSGIGLPDRSYYQDPKYTDVRVAYRTYLEKIAKAAGPNDPATVAQRVLELETKIAAIQWDKVDTRDADKTYNPRGWNDLVAQAPEFDWNGWLAAQTDKPELFGTVLVDEPTFLTGVAKLWNDVEIDTWRDYLRVGIVRAFASILPKDIADAHFDFFSRTLNGIQQRPDRWKSAIAGVNSSLGELLGRKYVEQHFPAEAKTRANELVGNLLAAYKARFEDPTNWMSKPTREAAIVKLGKIVAKIGYPDKWRDYSGLTITRGQLITSTRAVALFESNRALAKLGKPVDKTEWGMSPQTVNAYYSADNNQIVFPAAILQAPFFDKDAENAVNYGGIGAVIGHEIGHAFDDQGRKYDGDGNLHDWWTPADKAAFEKKTQALIAQYNALVPKGLKPDQHVNGALTIGENLADLRGLEIALDAFAIAERAHGVTKPDYVPMFWSWARIWRDKQRPESLAQQMTVDPHSPGEFRCNQVVRNVADFYTTFDLKPGDKLYLPEDQRVTV